MYPEMFLFLLDNSNLPTDALINEQRVLLHSLYCYHLSSHVTEKPYRKLQVLRSDDCSMVERFLIFTKKKLTPKTFF